MPNFTNVMTIFECVRNAGVPMPGNDKLRVGGRYHPAYTKANGEQVSARWTGSLAINHRSYRNAQNQPVEVKPDYVRLTVWSSKNANGNGMAERYARFMSIGLELIVHAGLKPYKADQYDGGVKLVRADGTAIQVEKIGFTAIPGSTMIIGESQKQIDTEIQQGIRPQFWNVKGHQDFATWTAKIAAKNAEMYRPGMTMFGNAVVVLDKGAQPNAYAGVLAPGAAPLVQGHTYEAWKAANPGLTDEAMLAQPMFQAFVPMIQAKKVAGNLAVPGLNTPAAQPVVLNAAGANAGAFNQPY